MQKYRLLIYNNKSNSEFVLLLTTSVTVDSIQSWPLTLEEAFLQQLKNKQFESVYLEIKN